jgi:hypothetical protein
VLVYVTLFARTALVLAAVATAGSLGGYGMDGAIREIGRALADALTARPAFLLGAGTTIKLALLTAAASRRTRR